MVLWNDYVPLKLPCSLVFVFEIGEESCTDVIEANQLEKNLIE